MPNELEKFNANTVVNSSGELVISAGRFSRGAVVVAFQMMGGIEKFAEWAEDNPSEFYTKMFGKTIGREPDQQKSGGVEDMLNVLDGDYDEVTDEDDVDVNIVTDTDVRLSRAAIRYANGEPEDE